MCAVRGCGWAVAFRHVWEQSPPNAGSVLAAGLWWQGMNERRGPASVRSMWGSGRVLKDG